MREAVGEGGNMPQSEPHNLVQLYIADLEHFGESLLRNEELGERRVNFFSTLVTATIAGLGVLYTADNAPELDALKTTANGAAFVLFVFGVLTYLRVLHRNHVT